MNEEGKILIICGVHEVELRLMKTTLCFNSLKKKKKKKFTKWKFLPNICFPWKKKNMKKKYLRFFLAWTYISADQAPFLFVSGQGNSNSWLLCVGLFTNPKGSVEVLRLCPVSQKVLFFEATSLIHSLCKPLAKCALSRCAAWLTRFETIW